MNTTDTLEGIFKIFRGIIFSSHTLQQKIQLLCHYQQGWLDQIRKGPILSTSTSLQPFCIFLIQLHVKLPPDQPGREMFASMAGAFLQLLQLKTSQFTDQWLSDYWPASSFAASTASTASTTPASLDYQKREQTLQLVGTLLSVKCLAQPHLARRAYELCRPMLAAATMRPHTEHGRVAPHWNSSAVRMGVATVLLHVSPWDDFITTSVLALVPEWIQALSTTSTSTTPAPDQELQMHLRCCTQALFANTQDNSVALARANVVGRNVLRWLGSDETVGATGTGGATGSGATVPRMDGLYFLINALPPMVLPSVALAINQNGLLYDRVFVARIITRMSTWPLATLQSGVWLEVVLNSLLLIHRYDVLVVVRVTSVGCCGRGEMLMVYFFFGGVVVLWCWCCCVVVCCCCCCVVVCCLFRSTPLTAVGARRDRKPVADVMAMCVDGARWCSAMFGHLGYAMCSPRTVARF